MGIPVLVYGVIVMPLLATYPELDHRNVGILGYGIFIGLCVIFGSTVFTLAWYFSYVIERRICCIYDYRFKDDIFCDSLKDSNLRLPDQETCAFEFESLKVVDDGVNGRLDWGDRRNNF